MRRTEARSTGIDALKSGIEGYAASMKRYPVLSVEQTEAALVALRGGQSLHQLRAHTLFAPHLDKEERDLFNNPNKYHASPVHSYRQLFSDSPTIGHLVSFGNFPTVLTWAQRFQATYHDVPLPLEEFMQNALYKIVPEQAKHYNPMSGSSFKSYMSNMLIWKLDSLVDASITRRSMLPAGVTKAGRKAKHDSRRRAIESLDASFPEETDNGEEVSLYDIVEQTHVPALSEHLERTEALSALLKEAEITLKEAQVLQTYIIEGEAQDYAAATFGVTERTIRGRRDQAAAKFRRLGYENVVSILNGERDAIPPMRR